MESVRHLPYLRFCVGVALLFGILMMQHAVFSTPNQAAAVQPAVAISSLDDGAPGVATPVGADEPEIKSGMSLAGCCGIIVLCAAAIGLGALLALRGRRDGRPLWTLPLLMRVDPHGPLLLPSWVLNDRHVVLRC